MKNFKNLPSCLTPKDRVILFDGVCQLCSHWSHFVIKRDPQARLKLASIQSESGKEILQWCDLPIDDCDTMVFVNEGKFFTKSGAFLRAVRYLNWPWPLLSIGIIVPYFLRDILYDLIAKNRYRLFGKNEVCMVPTADIKQRFLP